MLDRNKQDGYLYALAVASIAGWALLASQAGITGFPLDDGWIHQTYARSLAQGGGWAFTPGLPSAGATAPLWVLLLVPGYWLGFSPYIWVLFLGALTLCGVVVMGAAAWEKLTPLRGWWSLAAGAALAFEWHLVWAAFSGMETLFYSALAFGILLGVLHLSERAADKVSLFWVGLGALAGIGVWVRPEAVTLLGPIGFVAWLKPTRDAKQRFSRLVLAGAGFLAIFLLYLGFNRWLAGAWWPNTFFAKQAEYAVLKEAPLGLRLLNQFVPLLAGVGAALLPGVVIFMVSAFKRRQWGAVAGGLWALGHVCLYALRLPVIYQHGRYILPVMPVWVIWGLAGYAQALSGHENRIKWVLSRVWGASVGLLLLGFWGLGFQSYQHDVAFINGEMVLVADWLEENSAKTDLVAAHDIGAIGYFAQRPILDLAGLVSPDVIPFIRDETRLAEYLVQKCPAYLVTFPSWYPDLVQGLAMVYQTDTGITRELGEDNMAVYRWTNCVE